MIKNNTNGNMSSPEYLIMQKSLQESSFRTPRKQRGAVPIMPIVAGVVIVAIIGTSYFLMSRQKAEMEMLHTYVAKVETELGQKNDVLKEFKSNLTKISADSTSSDIVINDNIRTLQDHLDNLDQKFKNIPGANHEDWVLSEIEFLVSMAQLRIGMKEDVKGALGMLNNATLLLEKMANQDEGLKKVRLAINKDIKDMEVYKEVDVPGTYSALVTLGETIEKLPLLPVATEKSIDGSASTEAQPTMLSEINDTMAGYLTIRKHDMNELKLLLSPEQRLNFRDSIRLTFEQAETALMRGDQVIYDQSLVKIRKWVLEGFDGNNFKVQMANKKIDDLSKVQVKRDLPSVADSQQELKRYLSDRMQEAGGLEL